MTRRRSTTKNILLLVIISFACVGGYTLWNSYGEPAYDVAAVKYNKVRKALKE